MNINFNEIVKKFSKKANEYLKNKSKAKKLLDDAIEKAKRKGPLEEIWGNLQLLWAAKGVPILPSFPAWTDTAYLTAQSDAQKKYANVDMKFFNDYFEWIKKPGVLHLEEPLVTQDLYQELTNVLQAVFINKNADVTKLMNTVNTNVQALLDGSVNK